MTLRIRSLAVLIVIALISVGTGIVNSQSRQQVKVVVEFQQSGDHSQAEVGGRGQVIIERGRVHPSGRVIAQDRQTKVQQSTGILPLCRMAANLT